MSGLCECGCGEVTRLAPYADKTLGWTKGQPIRFRQGHNTRGRRMPREPLEAKWTVNPDTGCWEWQRSRGPEGYGHSWHPVRRLYTKAHVVVYELLVGPTPVGLELDHLCRVRHCVNPEHLEPVTHAENARRGRAGKYLRERTHCAYGHEFIEANVYWTPQGHRKCRPCIYRRTREWRQRQVAA